MIFIDYDSTHNMMSTSFARNIGLHLTPIKPCSSMVIKQSTMFYYSPHVEGSYEHSRNGY